MVTISEGYITYCGRVATVDGFNLYVDVAPTTADGCASCSLGSQCLTPKSKGKRVRVCARISKSLAAGMTDGDEPLPGDTVTVQTPRAAVTRATTLLLTVPLCVFVATLAVALICDATEATAALGATIAGAVAMVGVHLYSKRSPVWVVTSIKRTPN